MLHSSRGEFGTILCWTYLSGHCLLDFYFLIVDGQLALDPVGHHIFNALYFFECHKAKPSWLFGCVWSWGPNNTAICNFPIVWKICFQRFFICGRPKSTKENLPRLLIFITLKENDEEISSQIPLETRDWQRVNRLGDSSSHFKSKTLM